MRKEWNIAPDQGLWLFRASRLEALLDPLESLLAHLPPDGWLTPQTVLVGHPGLQPWLRQRLAERRGPTGIVANLDLVLPGPWLDGLAQTLLELPAAAARNWQREVLRWRLLAELDGLADERVQALLAADDGTQAFALTERLSAALAPLMLYRPDWLPRWQRGETVVAGDALLAAAWRALGRGLAARHPHRGERLQRLARRLHEADARPTGLTDDPLHVFGLHHLAPPELAVLHGLACWRPVVLYVADPCQTHWLGMGSGRAAMRAALVREDLGEADFLALDHPLLAAWGRLGQHFLLALEDTELALNERHAADGLDATPSTLLERLQHSLRCNDPEALRVDAAAFAALDADASLRVLRCATPLRELELLREALAEAFAENPDLQPGEVAVLAPDLGRYRPLLPAVFGEAGRRDTAWPWQAADLPLAALHPVYRALAQALALSGTRLSAAAVLDLLAYPPLARRFRLENQSEGPLRHALARLGVAWGLDGDDRARFAAPAEPAHTFAWGLDRAMAGHVFGTRDAEPLTLPDGARLLPGEGIDAGVADILGRLHALLLELREWTALGESRQPPKDWQIELHRRIDGLFEAAPGDNETQAAIDTVHGLIAELGTEWDDAALTAPLPWPAVRAALQAKLAAVPERQRFLVGGITFCSMVPQRAIPFRVIAVLGLDEGALPRHAPEDGFDLRRRAPRRGDRDFASDDRYLFLETLMATRERLHLSFLGVGAEDGRLRNPATPLADLLDTLARFVPPPGSAKPDTGWPWQRQAPLQPQQWPSAEAAPAAPAAPAATAAIDPSPTLDALVAFFRDPARQALRDAAGVRLDALDDDRLDEHEPLLPRADPREAMARRLVLAALEQGAIEPPAAIPEALRLAGRLPPGELGEQLWQTQRAAAIETLDTLRKATPTPALPLSPLRHWPIHLAWPDGSTLEGRVPLHQDAAGTLWLIEAVPGRAAKDLHFGRRLPLLLHWLALRLSQSPPVRVALLGKTVDGLGPRLAARDADFLASLGTAAEAHQRADLQGPLQAAIEYRAAVLRGDRLYLPNTSWVAWRQGDDDSGSIEAAWTGGEHASGERDHAPGYAALWGPHWRFAPGENDRVRLIADARALVERFPLLVDPADAGGDGDSA